MSDTTGQQLEQKQQQQNNEHVASGHVPGEGQSTPPALTPLTDSLAARQQRIAQLRTLAQQQLLQKKEGDQGPRRQEQEHQLQQQHSNHLQEHQLELQDRSQDEQQLASPCTPSQNGAPSASAADRCSQLEQQLLQQRDTIAEHEATIASFERDVHGICAHAHSCIQQSEAATQLAVKQAQHHREREAAALERERALEVALADANVNIRQLQLAAAAAAECDTVRAHEAQHAQQLKRICDTYETRIEELLRDLEISKQSCVDLQQRLDVANTSAQMQQQEQQLACGTYEKRIEKLAQLLQQLQLHQEQARKVEESAAALHDNSADAHDRDFTSLKSLVTAALADDEQLQRLWRSIDVTDKGSITMSAFNMWLAARFPHLRSPALRLTWKFLIPSGAPMMACDFNVLLKAFIACVNAVGAFFKVDSHRELSLTFENFSAAAAEVAPPTPQPAARSATAFEARKVQASAEEWYTVFRLIDCENSGRVDLFEFCDWAMVSATHNDIALRPSPSSPVLARASSAAAEKWQPRVGKSSPVSAAGGGRQRPPSDAAVKGGLSFDRYNGKAASTWK